MGLGPSDRAAGWVARLGRRLAERRSAGAEIGTRPRAAPPAPSEAPVIDVELSPPAAEGVAGPEPSSPPLDFAGAWWRMPPVGERPGPEPFPQELLRARSPRWLRRLRAGTGDARGEPFLRQLAAAVVLAAAVLATTSLPGAPGHDVAAAVLWTLHHDDSPAAVARAVIGDMPGLSSWLRGEGVALPAAAPVQPTASATATPSPAPGSPATTPMGKLVPPLQAPLAVGFGAPVPVPGGGGRTAPSQGVLFWATASAPVHAIAAGQVLSATASATLGRYVLINHVDGWSSLYGHCESVLVQSGERVGQGQSVCTTGRVGSRFGPYLYFELLLHGKPVDPAPYLGLKEAVSR